MKKQINIVKDFGIAIVLILLIVILSVVSPGHSFATLSNLINVLRQCSVYAIIAFGMTYVVISGGIDLSVGSVVALASCVVAKLIVEQHVNIWLAVLAAILTGGLCGLINGVAVTFFKVPFFLATVGMMYIARGAALVMTHESPINGLPKSFDVFGSKIMVGGSEFPIPPQVIIAILVFVVLYIILNHTKTGRYTYAIGSNCKTAALSGVNVKKYTIWFYVISGLCAGISGVIMASRLKIGSPIIASGYEMDAIAAVAIGGTSMMGGQGGLLKTVMGALVLTVIRVGLNILGISTSVQQIIIGAVIIVVVAADMYDKATD